MSIETVRVDQDGRMSRADALAIADLALAELDRGLGRERLTDADAAAVRDRIAAALSKGSAVDGIDLTITRGSR